MLWITARQISCFMNERAGRASPMCLFCDIANHKSKAHIVCETEKTITFLDTDPVNEGHVLIVPRLHVDSLLELPDEYVLEITSVSRRIIRAYEEVYHATGYGVMQNGGTCCAFGHFHFHVFPRFSDDGYDWIYPNGEKEVSEQVALFLPQPILQHSIFY